MYVVCVCVCVCGCLLQSSFAVSVLVWQAVQEREQQTQQQEYDLRPRPPRFEMPPDKWIPWRLDHMRDLVRDSEAVDSDDPPTSQGDQEEVKRGGSFDA